MKNYGTVQIDNRDAGQMYEYLEARIDVLKRRISELERENQVLRIHVHRSDMLAIEDTGCGCPPALACTVGNG